MNPQMPTNQLILIGDFPLTYQVLLFRIHKQVLPRNAIQMI